MRADLTKLKVRRAVQLLGFGIQRWVLRAGPPPASSGGRPGDNRVQRQRRQLCIGLCLSLPWVGLPFSAALLLITLVLLIHHPFLSPFSQVQALRKYSKAYDVQGVHPQSSKEDLTAAVTRHWNTEMVRGGGHLGPMVCLGDVGRQAGSSQKSRVPFCCSRAQPSPPPPL